jgi:ankyrin repeat domain-containing protein 50
LLQLVLNPTKQEADHVEALEYVANLLRQSRMREALYRERYEAASNYEGGHVSRIEYRESLKELYIRILLFEATSVCYLSRKTVSRIALNTVKWNDWKTLLASIKSQEEIFSSVNELWKETKYQEECAAANLRHLQHLESMDAIGDEVSRLSGLIHQVQLDDERIKLLEWLSSIDTSKKYAAARATHAPRTGDWLTHDSIDFRRWKGSQNSFLWLHGKGTPVLFPCSFIS